jgi:hypothetical protein
MDQPKIDGEKPTKDELRAAKEKMLRELSEATYVDVSTLSPTDGPPATPERAAEIAGTSDFGLEEFFELTGVGEGTFSTFTADKSGVRPTIKLDKSLWTTAQWVKIKAVTEGLTLKFPCSANDFADWHKRTQASNGVSDFPLAAGFLKALKRQECAKPIHGDVAVTSEAIIAAFTVVNDPDENRTWWNDRLRSATKHQGLLDARKEKGAAKRMSTFYPRLIGLWLIDKGHMSHDRVIAAIKTNFPEADLDWI